MCQVCNGTHVVVSEESYAALFQTCPVCGPEPEEMQVARLTELRMKLGIEVKG